MESPDLCRDCGGKCCTAPFFTNEEYMRAGTLLGNDILLKGDPVPGVSLAGAGWMFRKTPCPLLTLIGCRLDYPDRPRVCRLYPFIEIPTNDGKTTLLLALRTCPRWREFGERYEEAKTESEN